METDGCLLARGEKPVLAPTLSADAELAWFEGKKRRAFVYHRFREAKARKAKIEESLAPYAKSVQYAPRSGLIRASYAHALLESQVEPKKRQAEAIKQLTLALQTEPREARSHRMLAIAYGKQGQQGLSHLHLAEESLLQNKLDNAIRESRLAGDTLSKNSASWLRSTDILALAQKKKKQKKD